MTNYRKVKAALQTALAGLTSLHFVIESHLPTLSILSRIVRRWLVRDPNRGKVLEVQWLQIHYNFKADWYQGMSSEGGARLQLVPLRGSTYAERLATIEKCRHLLTPDEKGVLLQSPKAMLDHDMACIAYVGFGELLQSPNFTRAPLGDDLTKDDVRVP